MLKLAYALAALPTIFLACGSNIIGADDIAMFDAEGTDTTIVKDAPSGDVVEKDSTPFNGGGPFLCLDCVCDGTLNLCEHFSGGKTPILQDAGTDASDDAADSAFGDAGTCVEDAGQPYCAAIPVDCLPKPTCACLAKHFAPGCACDVDPSGSGFVITCINP